MSSIVTEGGHKKKKSYEDYLYICYKAVDENIMLFNILLIRSVVINSYENVLSEKM